MPSLVTVSARLTVSETIVTETQREKMCCEREVRKFDPCVVENPS